MRGVLTVICEARTRTRDQNSPRALVLEPEVLFLDEPFAALDQPSRRRLVRELAVLLRVRRMATVFVTHDFAEASILCDRCAILDSGSILQDEPVPILLGHPRTPRVAEIVGIENATEQGQ